MTTHAFNQAFSITVGHEGDFSDHPNDSGGATRFGITEAVARANGYVGPMQALSFDLARQIAYAQYWRQNRLDDVAAISNPVAFELFDTGYNMGIATAAIFLQKCLNAFNRIQRDYPDVKADGILGNMTIYALRRFYIVRRSDGEKVLLRALNGLQSAAYIELALRREKDEAFVFGQVLNRVAI
jgi:lysozyme family protein